MRNRAHPNLRSAARERHHERGFTLKNAMGYAHDERGESLVEIIISIVIMGVIVSAFFAALFTSSSASAAHRNYVNADTVLRNAAELTKSQVRNTCINGQTQFSVNFSSLSQNGITPPGNVVNMACPSVTGVQAVPLTVTWSGSNSESLQVDVRSP